jgi:8-oxo-dGTP diphosphatase
VKLPSRQQISTGGVAFSGRGGALDIAVFCTRERRRWQLPKGLIDAGEEPEQTALREVHEETGIEGQLLAPVEAIGYWYVGNERDARVRLHKLVHYFLFRYRAGDVSAHDHEIVEAR